MRKNNVWFLLLFIVGLYVLTNKGVVPLVTRIMSSDVGTGSSDANDEEPPGPSTSTRSRLAHEHCANYVKEHKREARDAVFDRDFKVWSGGGNVYLVKSSYLRLDPEEGEKERIYNCEIKFKGGDESNPEQWSVRNLELGD